MKQLETKAQFARRANIAKPTLTRHIREGGKLHDALVGNKIDVGHPVAAEYLESRGLSSTESFPVRREATERAGLSDDGSPDSMVRLQQLRLGELTEKMGGNPELAEWLKTLKTSEEVRHARLRNDELQGLIIRKELVEKVLFGVIDESNRRLLSDASRSITRQLYANSESGVPLEQSEREVRGIISKVLEPVYRKHEKVLRSQASQLAKEQSGDHQLSHGP